MPTRAFMCRRSCRCSPSCFGKRLPIGKSQKSQIYCRWARASGSRIIGWSIARSGDIVYLDVLGFWRRSHAEKHLENFRREHAKHPFILAVSDSLRIEDEELAALPAGIHRFRQMPLPDEIVKLAESSRHVPRVSGGGLQGMSAPESH